MLLKKKLSTFVIFSEIFNIKEGRNALMLFLFENGLILVLYAYVFLLNASDNITIFILILYFIFFGYKFIYTANNLPVVTLTKFSLVSSVSSIILIFIYICTASFTHHAEWSLVEALFIILALTSFVNWLLYFIVYIDNWLINGRNIYIENRK